MEANRIESLRELIRATLDKFPHVRSPKRGNKIHAELEKQLIARGFSIESKHQVRGDAWVDNEGRPAPATRREIDIALLDEGVPWAFIEVESDLDHAGKTGPGAHYSVKSIARSARGKRFVSYQSLERMAVAANPEVGHAPIVSDDPAHHNPRSMPLFLVVHNCTDAQRRVLEPRCQSLGAEIIPGWKRST